MATDESLLPPNATALEKALAVLATRLNSEDDLALPVTDLWHPDTCPAGALPWLAWALAVDRWDTDWDDDTKHAAVQNAIPTHRRRGSVAAVKDALASNDALLTLVQWFEASPQLVPHRFEVHLPVIGSDGAADGSRVSAATTEAIIADVNRAKPARSLFDVILDLPLGIDAAGIGAAQAMLFRRVKTTAADDSGIVWDNLLTNENGEPLTDDSGDTLDTSAAA